MDSDSSAMHAFRGEILTIKTRNLISSYTRSELMITKKYEARSTSQECRDTSGACLKNLPSEMISPPISDFYFKATQHMVIPHIYPIAYLNPRLQYATG